tara:strand:- start:63 stop:248 length:186 start_codon:yes stop_codon:yes gene_type:complete
MMSDILEIELFNYLNEMEERGDEQAAYLLKLWQMDGLPESVLDYINEEERLRHWRKGWNSQ